MVLMKIFNTILLKLFAIASRIVLPYKSIHCNRDIFCDEMVLIFFINTIAKPHVKRLIHKWSLIAYFHNDLIFFFKKRR